ncbi:MAG: pyridoxamine 5'-phosphate oxidase family protein [Bacteroidales bacterium]|nr:pyridoxamine 5'-phosphate oxidase family protein [Bacteroidales bacterium]
MVDQKFIDFINEHHVLTLASSAGNQPYCCNCFYAYNSSDNIFVIKTNEGTRHEREINLNSHIAASVVLETSEIGKIQGLQITGKAIYYTGRDLDEAKKTYLKKFPYAIAAPGEYLVLEPDFMKLTDNRFGFGKKLTWNKVNNG